MSTVGKLCVAMALGWFSMAGAPPAAAESWQVPSGYMFEPLPGCVNGRVSTPLYNACADQMTTFTAAVTRAKFADKSLLIVFGATWCPSCKSLKTVLPSPEWFAMQDLANRIEVTEIAISTLQAGRVTAVPSGVAVLDAVLASRTDVKQRAVPFLVVVHPVSGRVSARNLDDLEPRNGSGWDVAELARIAAVADTAVRGGAKATAEPGWLMRKWLRLVR